MTTKTSVTVKIADDEALDRGLIDEFNCPVEGVEFIDGEWIDGLAVYTYSVDADVAAAFGFAVAGEEVSS